MPAGKHTSVRVALAVPPLLHEQLSGWAEAEGRPVASLCLYLVENGLRQAQRDGIAPSIQQVAAGDDIDELSKEMSEEIRAKFKEICEEGNLPIKEVWSAIEEKIGDKLNEDDLQYLRDIVSGFKDFTSSKLVEMRQKLGDQKPFIKVLEEMKGIELGYMENISDRAVNDKGDDLERAMEAYGGQQVARKVASKKEQLLEKLLSALTE